MVGVVETDIAELKNFYELIKREYRQEMNKHTTAPTKDSWVEMPGKFRCKMEHRWI